MYLKYDECGQPYTIPAQDKPEVEDEVEFQIPVDRVFGNIKHALNIDCSNASNDSLHCAVRGVSPN